MRGLLERHFMLDDEKNEQRINMRRYEKFNGIPCARLMLTFYIACIFLCKHNTTT